MSHPQRVAVFNIFLFSKLTYIMNFYSIPYGYDASSLNVVVREIAMRLIPNFNRAYPYVFLIQLPARLGPSPPVRGVWNVSTATLAAKDDLSIWAGTPRSAWPVVTPAACSSLSMFGPASLTSSAGTLLV